MLHPQDDILYRKLKQEFWKSSKLNDAKVKITSEKKDWKEMYQMLTVFNLQINTKRITATTKLFVINIY